MFSYFRLLEKLRALVAMNENLKHQEQTFRSHCRVCYCNSHVALVCSVLVSNVEDMSINNGYVCV